jgi:integrase
VSYYKSVDFAALGPTTKTVRQRIIERDLRIPHGDKPVRLLGRGHIKDLIGSKSNTPEAANNFLKIIRVLLAHAVDVGMIDSNPAIGIRGYPTKGDGFHTWSEDEISQFQNCHPIGTRAGLALALLLHTAQRRADVVRMGWQHVQGNNIAVRQEKTGTSLLIPISDQMAVALTALPRTNMTCVTTEHGRVRQLVQGLLPRGRSTALQRSWSSESSGDQIGQCRLQRRDDQGDHRTQDADRGVAIHPRR